MGNEFFFTIFIHFYFLFYVSSLFLRCLLTNFLFLPCFCRFTCFHFLCFFKLLLCLSSSHPYLPHVFSLYPPLSPLVGTVQLSVAVIFPFLWPLAFFHFCVYSISIRSVVSGTLATGIWLCRHCLQLRIYKPGLVQGCKTPNGVGSACLKTSLESGLPHWTWSACLKSIPTGTQTCNLTIGPSQATPSLLIDVVLNPLTDMWGAVTNTG